MYQPRVYREWQGFGDLKGFNVQVSESDLYVLAVEDFSKEVKEELLRCRHQIETYMSDNPGFRSALKPYPAAVLAPGIIKDMCQAAQQANVGPMAAVAGAVAEKIGRELIEKSGNNVIVENGGDVFISSSKSRRIGIYAGERIPPFFINILPEQTPCGVCTSSGKMGHSKSFGKADSVTIIAGSCALADAAATAACNMVQSEKDIDKTIDFAMGIDGVKGIIIVVDKKIGIKGEIQVGSGLQCAQQ